MEKFLRPERLEVDPSSPNAAQDWTHWYATFSNFLADDNSLDSKKKLKLLTNFVTPTVYHYFNECTTFEDAITILKNIYVKPQNIVYARHRLATRKQLANESIDPHRNKSIPL